MAGPVTGRFRSRSTSKEHEAAEDVWQDAAFAYQPTRVSETRETLFALDKDLVAVLTSAIPIEDAAVMEPEDGPEPPIFRDFAHMLPGIELTRFGRFEFYEEASGPDTCLQIVTGDQRLYANLLLTIGLVAG